MLSHQILGNVRRHARNVVCARNFGIVAPMLQKATDPIQQLFLDKIREYKGKSGGGNKLFEPSADIERELKAELEKASKQYGGDAGVDMTQFPSFKFVDPTIDPIKFDK